MSKICGVFSFNRYTFLDDKACSKLQGLCNLTEEHTSFWFDKNIGFVQIDSTNNSRNYIQKDSYFKVNPNLRIVADATLTNRAELFRKFGILPLEQENFTDNDLILKSYDKWGKNCPKHLNGDFAFAIWDKQNNKLFCARDHLGVSTLFFYKDNEKFIFGSQPQLILCFKEVEKKFNVAKLGTYIFPETYIYSKQQSWYKKIHPLSAGTSITINELGIKSQKFWKPQSKNSLPYKKENEIYDAFRDLLFEIIQARLQKDSSAACLLSGGLDSSSIVSVAAKTLEKQNRELNVYAGVVPSEHQKRFADESFFIDQFKKFPNIKLNYVSSHESGPFSNLENFFEYHDTPLLTSRHYLYSAFSQKAQQSKTRTLFDGCFGEVGATSHGAGGFAEMFVKLKWLGLWRELKLRKALYNDSIKYNIRAKIINPLLPQFVKDIRHGKINNENQIKPSHPIKKELAHILVNTINLNKYSFDRNIPNHHESQINDLIILQEIMGENIPLNYSNQTVEFRFPLLDKRLIDFTLAIPLSLKFRDGYSRYLIRASLDKILPQKIQWRTTKSPFSPDYMRRYNSQINQVRDLLADIKSNDPIRELLNIEKISEWAKLEIPDTERGSPLEEIARDHLPSAIYLIYFLRKFSEFRL